nr:hypothetical protein [Tanacetum cinerariifolium]
MYGDLYFIQNEKLKEELQDIENLTEERIDEIIKWFLLDFKTAKLQENGWPLTTSAYKVSKAALNAYTRLLARKSNNIIVNCVHPGYVVTGFFPFAFAFPFPMGDDSVCEACDSECDGECGVGFVLHTVRMMASGLRVLGRTGDDGIAGDGELELTDEEDELYIF